MDTDIVSLMGRPGSSKGLRPWLLAIGIKRLALSYPVVAELLRGAHLKANDDPARAEAIIDWVETVLKVSFPYPAMTPEVATLYAKMTAVPALRHLWTVQVGQKSNRLGHDLMIAAVAVAYRMPILTANHRDYLNIHERFPLPGIYNPFKQTWFVEPDLRVELPRFDPDTGDAHTVALPKLERLVEAPTGV